MKRRVLGAVSAIALLVFALTCAAWVRSHWRLDQLSWNAEQVEVDRNVRRWASVGSASGGLWVDAGAWTDRPPAGTHRPARPASAPELKWGTSPFPRPLRLGADTSFDVFGFGWKGQWRRDTGDAVGSGFTLAVPHWAVALAALLPTPWWVRDVRRRVARSRARRGLCPACGYDLLATPEKCPECGELRAGAGEGEAGLGAR